MANGYLGKISALVTANTGDFKPKLDAAASEVTSFARKVEGTLRSASSQSAKAFDDIYTPIQKMERALQAASSMKLSFKGFDGAIKNIDELKLRLASLGKRQIDIDVTGTGFKKVAELREAIKSITAKDVNIVAGMGGLTQARQVAAAMNATGKKGGTFWDNSGTLTKIDQRQLNEVLAKFVKINSLSQVRAAIGVVGETRLKESVLRMQQMHSAAELIAKPLAEAARTSLGFGIAIQTGIGPALKAAQADAESVKQTMTNGMAVAEARFSAVGRTVRALAADMKQLSEASSLVAGMKTGNELAFQNPRLAAQLAKAQALSSRAAEMPEGFLASNPNTASLVQQLNAVSQKAVASYSSVLGATSGKDAATAAAGLGKVQGVLDGLIARLSKTLPINIDTTEAKSKVSDLESHLVGLSSRRVTNLPPNFFRDRLAEQERKRDADIDGATQRFSRRATILPPNYLPDKLQENEAKRFKAMFGDALGTPAARVGELTSRVRSLQSAMADLPAPVQSKLIPALERAKQAIFALGNNPTARELARAAQEAGNLERNLKRAQTAAQFRGNFGSFLSSNAASGYAAQLNTIRQGMAAVGATASGPVATAIGKYQKALIDSAKAGTLATSATKNNLDDLLKKISQVAVATNLMNQKQATTFVDTVRRSGKGDIGRMGAGNAGLALNQAAYAVDDFMSTSGGIEQKLRGVSNNITQMAFLLGGTKGLFIGLGAVIAANVAIPIAKAIFDFAKFEKQNESLNDQLEKSRDIAKQTSEAYRDLAKSIRESGESGGRQKVASFAEDRRREAKDASEARVFGSSRRFSEADSEVKSLEEDLKKETDIGRRGQLQRKVDEARKRRDAVIAAGISAPSLPSVAASIDEGRAQEMRLRSSSKSNWELTDANSRKRFRAAAVESTPDLKSSQQAVDELKKQIENLGDAISSSNLFDRLRASYAPELFTESSGTTQVRRAREKVADLEEEKARLEEDIRLKRNERFMPRAMAAAAAAELTPGVRERVSQLGLDSDVTSRFDSDIAAVTKNFADIITELERVTRSGGDTTELEKAADKSAKALEYLYQEADKFARDVALGALVPTKERLSRAAEQLSGFTPSNVATDIARVQARRSQVEIERERAMVRGDDFGVAGADYELDRIRRLTDKLESAAIAVATFQRAIEEAALSLSNTLVQDARNREAELRRSANRFAGRGQLGVAVAAAAAEAAAEADRQEDRDRRLREIANRERIKFEGEDTGKVLAARIREGREKAENKELPAAEQEAGRASAERAQAEFDRLLEQRVAIAGARAGVDGADRAAAERRDRVARENQRQQREFGGLERALGGVVSGSGASLGAAVSLNEQMRQLQRDMEDALAAGIESPFQDLMDELRVRIEELNAKIVEDKILREQTRSSSTEGRLDAARSNLRGYGMSGLDAQMTEIDVRRKDLERRRDEALAEGTPKGDERAVALNNEIEAQNQLAADIVATSVALGGLQEALNSAALALQNTLVGETTSRYESARRQANEAEAVFGRNSPEHRRAMDRRDRAERDMRDSEDKRREADKAIGEEKAKFEAEIANGQNPAAAARAERIARLEEEATDQNNPNRAAARAEADRLREEQRQEFENRPEVQRRRRSADEADTEMARRQSVERGLEMGRTEEEKRREDIRRQAGDLGNMADELRGWGDGAEADDRVRKSALNMAREMAPLYAQLGEEVMTARLQGPSRAALQASDIATSSGASELNRLIRGEDSARDVNLTELKKQSSLLERIEKAILDETGVVVNL